MLSRTLNATLKVNSHFSWAYSVLPFWAHSHFSWGELPFFIGKLPWGPVGSQRLGLRGGHWQFYWVSDAWALGEGAMRMELANATWKSPMDSRRVPGIYMVRRCFPLSWCLVHSASAFFLHPLQAVLCSKCGEFSYWHIFETSFWQSWAPLIKR